MTKTELLVITRRMKEELENIARLENELVSRGLLGEIQGKGSSFPLDDSFTRRAIGSILHDLYVACENMFEIIGREIDQALPSNPSWHRALLQQMTLDIPGVRPAVLRKETATSLDKYRSFRHVFRNVYGFNLESDRLMELLRLLPSTLQSLRTDVNGFIEGLHSVLRQTR